MSLWAIWTKSSEYRPFTDEIEKWRHDMLVEADSEISAIEAWTVAQWDARYPEGDGWDRDNAFPEPQTMPDRLEHLMAADDLSRVEAWEVGNDFREPSCWPDEPPPVYPGSEP